MEILIPIICVLEYFSRYTRLILALSIAVLTILLIIVIIHIVDKW